MNRNFILLFIFLSLALFWGSVSASPKARRSRKVEQDVEEEEVVKEAEPVSNQEPESLPVVKPVPSPSRKKKGANQRKQKSFLDKVLEKLKGGDVKRKRGPKNRSLRETYNDLVQNPTLPKALIVGLVAFLSVIFYGFLAHVMRIVFIAWLALKALQYSEQQ